MSHTIRRTAAWVLAADRAPGAPHAVYGAECLACPAASGRVDNNATPVEVWAIDHTAQHGLAHSQFLVRTESHWTVNPRLDAPPAPQGPPEPGPTGPRNAAPPSRRTAAIVAGLALATALLALLLGVELAGGTGTGG